MATPEDTFEVTKGMTGLPLTATLTNEDGSAIVLTGCTVTVKITRKATGAVKVAAGACTIVSALAGQVSYAWQASDVDTVGLYDVQFTVTLPSGTGIAVPTDDDERFATLKVIPTN